MFGLAAAVVWIAGTRLAVFADAIADRKRIGKALMGLVFLAAATELPELVTTISAAMKNNAALVLNNMFGGITDADSHLKAWLISADGFSARDPVVHATLIQFLRHHESNAGWRPIDLPDEGEVVFGALKRQDLDAVPLNKLYGFSFVAVLAILAAGLLLVQLAEVIALQSGLGSSFVGVTLLAASTSLPELSTTIAAVRIGAYTMAISNIFGSNLIMVALLFPADAFYAGGGSLNRSTRRQNLRLFQALLSLVSMSLDYWCAQSDDFSALELTA